MNNSLYELKMKYVVYGAGATWSRLLLPGAGVDPIRSDPDPESAPGPRIFQSRSRPKKLINFILTLCTLLTRTQVRIDNYRQILQKIN